jgi:alpha-glucosidase
LLTFIREFEGEQLLVCFNFSNTSHTIALSSLTPHSDQLTPITDHQLISATVNDGTLNIPAFGCFYSKL